MKMLISSFFTSTMLGLLLTLMPGCNKEGCTDPKASNYDADAKESDGSCTFDKTDDVVEIAIRQVKTGQEAAFTSARTAFIAKLMQQPYVYNDREFASFFHFNPAQDTTRPVFIGMTQYEDLDAFQSVSNALGTSAEAGAFFSTFDALVFTAMKPVKAGTPVDLSQLTAGGQILEVAVRDLSKYENFNQADYEAKRDAFLAVLAQQPGRVAEYQWQSVLDPNLVIGMTVYTSAEAFMAISADPAFNANPAVGAFFSTYPPTLGGEVCTIVK